MSLRREIAVVARLDLAEVLRSRWLVFCLVVHTLLAAVFVLVGLRESGVIGFTGMGRGRKSIWGLPCGSWQRRQRAS